ncbi:serine hydrolase domain-containing protein [Agromyces sp. NPDC056523]|uniref:serine hydrolase domain-containing protein n=1 Tax=Agromyces sp. NPDC056523 TaxID=3345850 RepID=UPI00367339C5
MTAANEFATRLDRHLARTTARRGALGAPQVAVSAPRLGIEYRSGEARPFHVASVGKLFTATLVMQLVESGVLALDGRVSGLLPSAELERLFDTTDEPDVAGTATLAQLLTHTAGVADYFEGPVTAGHTLVDLVVDEPDTLWTPADLLSFSRDRQRPVGRPGERFAYSDTGYVLLGRILEEATGQAFHDLLRERIFAPLDLRDSWLCFHSTPENRPADTGIAPLWIGRHELSRARSLSCDWAGGGIASTPEDLLAFSSALHGGRLLTPESMAYLAEPRHRFRPGIRYGAGMMQLRFEGFSPFLRGMPRPVGHLGVLATHVFHDPVHEAEIVLNFASTKEMVRSVRTLIEVERLLARAAG